LLVLKPLDMRRRLIYPLLLLTFQLAAQRIENVRAEVFGEGEKVVITYDINGGSPGQKFRVTVYGSHNNFAAPLTLVSGDVGRDRELTGGPNKRVEWSAKSELKDFSGDVTFEVRAEVVAAVFSIQSPAPGGKVKRGKTAEIVWQGGNPGENVRLDLLKGGTVISQIASTQNSQRYSWPIPKSTGKGSDYQVRVSGESGAVTSGNFAIKSKTPGIVKVLPFLVAGAVAYFIFSGEDKVEELPSPPTYNGN
jgi:hypothetical protein